MSDREDNSGEGRLSRWARLKTQAKAGQDIDALEEAPAEGEVPAPTADEAEESDFVLEDLPNIETLDKDSDFTPFLNINVPDHLRRMALRKLWVSDPVLANLDGLNDYDEDYSSLGMIAEKVTSVFQPGKGMPDPEPEPEPEQDPQQPAEEEVAETSNDDDVETLDDPEAELLDAEEDLTASAQDPDAPDDLEEPTA